MSAALWTNARHLIAAGPAALVTAPVAVEVTTLADSAPAGYGAGPREWAPAWSSRRGALLPTGWASTWALPTMLLLPCTTITAVPREKPHFKENKPLAWERVQRGTWPPCCHLLPIASCPQVLVVTGNTWRKQRPSGSPDDLSVPNLLLCSWPFPHDQPAGKMHWRCLSARARQGTHGHRFPDTAHSAAFQRLAPAAGTQAGKTKEAIQI